MKYSDFLAEAKKPIPYQWRVQSRNREKTRAVCAAFIDARDVMNRLDEIGVVWETEPVEIDKFIFCRLTISFKNDDGYHEVVTRTDVGARPESDANDQMYEQAGKAAFSDALKRAAVQFGIGRFLYDIPTITLPCDQNGNVVDEAGQRVWNLTEYINDLKGRKTKPAPAATPAPDGAKPKLDQKKMQSMIEYIAAGKIDEVEKAMENYSLTNAQKMVLQGSIKTKRNEATENTNK